MIFNVRNKTNNELVFSIDDEKVSIEALHLSSSFENFKIKYKEKDGILVGREFDSYLYYFEYVKKDIDERIKEKEATEKLSELLKDKAFTDLVKIISNNSNQQIINKFFATIEKQLLPNHIFSSVPTPLYSDYDMILSHQLSSNCMNLLMRFINDHKEWIENFVKEN
mgnify:CR=1 FL=1